MPSSVGLALVLGSAGCEDRRATPSGARASAAPPTPSRDATPGAPPTAAPSGPAPSSPPSASAPPRAVADRDAPRVYAKTRFVWVRPEPDASTQWIGFLSVGGSAKLRRTKPNYGPGCGTWYAIEPRGYVCVDGTRATLDENDPVFISVLPYAPKLDTPWPHNYGESLGLRRLRVLPSKVASAPPFPPLPNALFEDRTELLPRSTVAYSHEVEGESRSWLLSADYMWVPKDRVTPYPRITFRGVALGGDVRLPIAFFRDTDKHAYRRVETRNGVEFQASATAWNRLEYIALSGKTERLGQDVFWETKAGGDYVRAADAVIPSATSGEPEDSETGATSTAEQTGGAPHRESTPPQRQTLVEVSILGGWLIAYEGSTPVYVTLIAAGRGGPPVPGKPTIETASTPTGRFVITGKFATATMEAPNEFIHSSVPWAQNFSGPYALHGAYWHDDWGKLKSGGCVNLSPIDGKWLYDFTDPKVPDGWYGVRWLSRVGSATRLIVRK